jgi:hypothetical protein
MIASLAASPPSALGPAVAKASGELPALQAQEKAQLKNELPIIDRPTGLPARDQQATPAPTQLNLPAPTEGVVPEGREGQPPPEGGEVASGPIPGAEVSTIAPEPPAESTDDDSWWSSIWGRIRSFLESLPTNDPNVSTSAGPRPTVDRTGAADVTKSEEKKQEADAQVRDARGRADGARAADFGEHDIAPVVPGRERLRPRYELAQPPAASAAGGPTPAVDPEVQAAFDQQAAPMVAETAAEQRAQEAVDREEYRRRSDEVRAEGERQIADETKKSRAEQTALRNAARAEVQGERERWRTEDERADKAYSEKAETEKRETYRKVDEKAKSAEQEADQKLTDAEREAEAEKRAKEAEAARKKREAESRPRSWWDRVKGAVSSAFSALKRFVTKVFNELRAFVKKVINKAKALVRGLIELARRAIVGLIKAFGAALKLAVSLVLIAFPETARKARAYIDGKVNGAVSAVNAAADALKAACDKILDAVAAGLDFALGLLQKAVLFYIELYEKLVMLLLDVLERIGNLVSAAKQMPDHFFGQVSEEVLGMDLTQPLPMERLKPLEPAEAAKAGGDAGAIEPADARAVTKSEMPSEQLELDQPPLEEDLEPELLDQFDPQEGKEVELGERTGPEFGLAPAQEAAMGLPVAPGQATESNEPAGAAPALAAGAGTDGGLEQFKQNQDEDPCAAQPHVEAAGPSQIPEEMKIGPLKPLERGAYMLDQMVKGIKKWFACNWGKLLAAAVAVLLGAILLNVLTGGAILAALPLIGQVVTAVMAVAAVARVLSYLGDYLVQGWGGAIAAAAKALARAIAIAAVELIFALLFNLKAVMKALKGGLKGAVKAGAAAAKATLVTGVKATRSLGRLGVQAAKTAVKNGRLILTGLRSGVMRGARTIKEFVARLWKNLRFKRFKIVFRRGWFFLLAEVNGWIVVMKGRLKGQLRKVDKAQTDAVKGQLEKQVKAKTFKTLEGETVTGKLVSRTDDIPTDYRKTMEIFTGDKIDDYVVHHMIEQQTRKLTDAVEEVFLHSPANLKLIRKGEINAVVHLSRIRRMWNVLYKTLDQVPDAGKLAALQHFGKYTDEFITHMLKFAEKRGKSLTRTALELEADKWLKALQARAKEARDVGQAFKPPKGTAAKAVK